MKKLLNLEWSWPNIDNPWKNKTFVTSTETFRIMIKLSKTFLETQSFFIIWNHKQTIFILGQTGSGKRSWLTSKGIAEILFRIQNLYQITYDCYTLCNLFQFNPLIPTDWHQEKPFAYSVFAESNYLFTQHIYLAAYLAVMLQAPWHIPDGK